MTRRAWIDAAVTILVAVVLAIAVAYGLLALAFSDWGDRPLPTPTSTPAAALWNAPEDSGRLIG